MIYLLHSSDNLAWDFYCDSSLMACTSVRPSLHTLAVSLAVFAAGLVTDACLYRCSDETSLSEFLSSYYQNSHMHIYLQFDSMSDLRAYLDLHPEYLL